MIAVGQRYARIGGAARSGSHARHDLEGDALARQRFDLLAAAPEDERIAALQAQHTFALAGEAHQHFADLILRHGVVLGLLADKDTLGVAADQVEDAVADQPVVQHHVGLLHQPECAEGKQIRIARPCAYQVDLTDRLAAAFLQPPLQQ